MRQFSSSRSSEPETTVTTAAPSWQSPSIEGRPVTVLGAGVLGRRIAAAWASHGYTVHIRDVVAAQLVAASEFIEANAERFNPAFDRRKHRLDVMTFEDLGCAVASAWLVIEAVPERLDIKIPLYAELETLAPFDAILATNSSSYKSRDMAARVGPETAARMHNMHYFMPPTTTLVELMTSGSTQPAILSFIKEHLVKTGMVPIVAQKESTGFIANRVYAAIKREFLMIVAEGVSTPQEMDMVWKDFFQTVPIAPFAVMDMTGLDVVRDIEKHYIDERSGLDKTGVLQLLDGMISEGRLGAKCKKGGFYPAIQAAETEKPTAPAMGAKDAQTNNAIRHTPSEPPTLYILDTQVGCSELADLPKAGRILTGPADGSGPLSPLVADLAIPDGIALLGPLGRIVWSCMGFPWKKDGRIMTCALDGSDVRDLIPPGTVHTPKQVAYEAVSGKLFIADREGQRVWSCNAADGSDLQILVQTGDVSTDGFTDQTKWCVGVAVSPKEAKFYWSQKGPSKAGQGRILRANLALPAGETPSTRTDIELLFDKLPEPIDLEFDPDTDSLWWTDRGEMPYGNSLNRARATRTDKADGAGTAVLRLQYPPQHDILAKGLHEAIGLAIDRRAACVYVTDFGGGVYRFDLADGKNKARLYEQGNPTGIAIVYSQDRQRGRAHGTRGG